MAADRIYPRVTPKSCFTCVNFHGEVFCRAHTICHRPGLSPVMADPDSGCAFWQENPDRDLDVNWLVQYIIKHQTTDNHLPLRQFRPALTAAAIRQAYDLDPAEAAKKYAWEIARLQEIIVRLCKAAVRLRDTKSDEQRFYAMYTIVDLLVTEHAVIENQVRADAVCRLPAGDKAMRKWP